MEFAILSKTGLLFLFRWLHIFFGIIWIGHLYYFNFVQGLFFNEIDANVKSVAIRKLVPKALWWFRWGAMFTFITGWALISLEAHGNPAWLTSETGVAILTGALFASLMWYNVWFVIWPNQKVVIANAEATAEGKPADPNAAGAAARALLASRHNTLFSIPMLFFMAASKHLPGYMSIGSSPTTYAIVVLVIAAGLEFNALKGKLGPLTTVKGVIHMGFVLSAVLYALLEILN